MRCWISRGAAETIRGESATAVPHEACGLLLGAGDRIALAQTAANIAENPQIRFEIDPAALFAALRVERNGGLALLGYWHSHPGGDATPSPIDAAMAEPDGKLWLIAAGDRITAWRAGSGGLHGRFKALTLEQE